MAVKDLTLKEAREKLGTKQEELGKVFAEAKTDDGYDFRKVTCLGADVKGSIAVAEKVKAMNAELDELAQHAEALEGAELAAKQHGEREKGRRSFPLPGGGKGNYGSEKERFKALGEMATETKQFQDWVKNGCPDGITINVECMYPSDMMAAAMNYDTIGAKALMATSAGYAPESIRQPGYVEGLTRPIQLLDIIPTFQTDKPSIKYMEETTRTHGATEVAEGGAYAESTFVFTEKDSPVRKIGDSLPVTDEQLEDVSMMQGYGATPIQAMAVMEDAALALRRVSHRVAAQTLVYWVQSAGGYSSGREPETEWPRVFQSFQLLYALGRVS